MTDTRTLPAPNMTRVLLALAELDEATASAIAQQAGLAYSTVTPKLRACEDNGHAERQHNEQNQTLWHLTDAGRAAIGAAAAGKPPAESGGTKGIPAGRTQARLAGPAVPPPAAADTATERRPAGALRQAILDILRAHPDRAFTVLELCRAVDRARGDNGMKTTSAGAAANAAHKLVGQAAAQLVAEKPATFALAHDNR